MNAQDKANAEALGYSVRLEERIPGNHSFWVYLNGIQHGGPFGSDSGAWEWVRKSIIGMPAM